MKPSVYLDTILKAYLMAPDNSGDEDLLCSLLTEVSNRECLPPLAMEKLIDDGLAAVVRREEERYGIVSIRVPPEPAT